MAEQRLVQGLLERVGPILAPHGFRLNRSRRRCTRKRRAAGISDFFYLNVINKEEGLRISPQVGLRHEVVERIFHRTSSFEEKYQADTPTLGTDLWELIGTESYITVASDSDLQEAVASVQAMFEQYALPYYERFSDLHVVNQVLNEAPNTPCPNRILNYLRAATGVIVAKLTQHASYDRLAGTYREQMSRFAGGYYLPNYDALVASLEDPETLRSATEHLPNTTRS